MKVSFGSILLFVVSLSIISCSIPEEEPQPLVCEEDALFSRESATGTMFYLSCYEAWSIKMDELNDSGNHLYAASKEIPASFEEEGLEVQFDGCFYEFDLPLIFPDPSFFGETYVIKDFKITVAEK